MTVCLVDTTVLCNIIPVPGLDQDAEDVLRDFHEYIDLGANLILPMAAIIETGNHIARHGDGRQRRATAKRFVEFVRRAIAGESPFSPTPFFEPEELGRWLDGFPDHAMREIALADLSIIEEFHKQCKLNPRREVFIWSLDNHLRGFRNEGN